MKLLYAEAFFVVKRMAEIEQDEFSLVNWQTPKLAVSEVECLRLLQQDINAQCLKTIPVPRRQQVLLQNAMQCSVPPTLAKCKACCSQMVRWKDENAAAEHHIANRFGTCWISALLGALRGSGKRPCISMATQPMHQKTRPSNARVWTNKTRPSNARSEPRKAKSNQCTTSYICH